MKLEQFKLEKDDGEHYHVAHPNGTKLKLHKKSLSYPAQRAIEKMACGGEVQKMADGGTADYPTPNLGVPPSIAAPVDDVTQFNPNAPYIGGGPDYPKQYETRVQENLKPSLIGGGAMAQDQIDPNAFGQPGKVMSQQEAESKALTDTGEQKKMDLRVDVQHDKQAQSNYQSQLDEYNKKVALGIDPGQPPQQPRMIGPSAADLPQQANIGPQAGQAGAPVGGGVNPFAATKNATDRLLAREQTQTNQYTQAMLEANKGATNAYENYTNSIKSMRSPQEIYQAYQGMDEALMKSYLDKTVDPTRFQHNMSTKSRVLAGISMVLGGLGQGLGQKNNPGVDWLNKSIEQDIEKQKQEQGKAMTLWKMNREAYGNDSQAELATRNQMLTGLQAQLSHAAADAQAPQIKFRGQQMINQIEQQKIQNRQRMTMLTQGMGQSGSPSHMDPLLLANDPTIVPPDMKQKYIDQVGKAQTMAQQKQELMTLWDKAAEEHKIKNGAGFTGGTKDALKMRLLPFMKDEIGRINPESKATFEENLPAFWETEGKAQAHRSGFEAALNSVISAPVAQSLGIRTENFVSTSGSPTANLSPQQRQYYNYAKAHPSAPESQAFFKKYPGLK